MSDLAIGGAPAPAETNSAALAETPLHNNPVSVAGTTAEPAPREALLTASDAIKAAQAKMDADAAKPAKVDPKPEPKAEVKAEPKARADDGKFAPKAKADPEVAQPQAAAKAAPVVTAEANQSEGRASKYEPPARFNDQGKSEWANAPESVQAEVHRTIKNLEDGYVKHKDAADRYEAVRDFDEAARRNGRAGLQDSLKQIVDIENAFARHPLEGFKKIADHFGLNLDAVAAHIAGKAPNEAVEAIHRENQELRAHIASQEQAQKMPSFVEEFADNVGRDTFDAAADDIAFFLRSGMIPAGPHHQRLQTAFELATRFKPPGSKASSANEQQTVQASSAAETASSAPAQAKPAGQKSISGAPSAGTSPGGKKRILSTSEALSAAMARA